MSRRDKVEQEGGEEKGQTNRSKREKSSGTKGDSLFYNECRSDFYLTIISIGYYLFTYVLSSCKKSGWVGEKMCVSVWGEMGTGEPETRRRTGRKTKHRALSF